MINPLIPLTKPEYLFRPRQLCLRLARLFNRHVPESDRVRLPWGQTITVRPREVIGASVWWYGLFDLIVTEAICRLLDSGETALDIGANMGQMTSLMRCQAGRAGRVISFEPHPVLFKELHGLAAEHLPGTAWAPAEVHQAALSDHEGEATLDPGEAWEDNRGLAKLVNGTRQIEAGRSTAAFTVRVTTLDQVLTPGTRVGVCKIDVEGHELSVFNGAARTLSERGIRDIVFEDFVQYPSPVHQFLLDRGFRLFALHTSLWRPRLEPVGADGIHFRAHDGMNYLATLDPDRARQRFRPGGWRVLSAR